MAVPDNYSFRLTDVVNEIPGGQTSLQECVDESTDSLFDNAYKGSKNSLRNFRNYNAAPPTLSITPGSFSASSNATSFTITVTSNTSWTVTDNASWVTRNKSSGSGNSTISVSLLQNTGNARFATVTVLFDGGSASCVIEQTGNGGGNGDGPGGEA